MRLGIGIGLLYALVMLIQGRFGWQAAVAGMAPGAVMLFYSRLSQGKLGWADGLMVIPAGLMQQWERCTAEVLAACFLVFLAAAALLAAGKANKNTKLPFAPFFLAAVMLVWTVEEYGNRIGG